MPIPNITEWRKKKTEGEWRELPSGLRMRVKRLSLLELAVSGRIPTSMTSQADDLLSKSIAPKDAVTRYLDAIRHQVMTAVLEPRVVPADQKPGENEVSIGELDTDDLLAVFNWLNSSPSTLLSFLETETK